jgi:hypothetical protein
LFGMLAGLAYLLILTLKAKLQTKKDAEKGMIE